PRRRGAAGRPPRLLRGSAALREMLLAEPGNHVRFMGMHPSASPRTAVDLFLANAAAERIRREIARARGNEVCFVCRVGEGGDVTEPCTLARGHAGAVLALIREKEIEAGG